jgi:hypothetical protein
MITEDANIKLIDVSSFFSFEEIRHMYSKGLKVKNERLRKFIQRHQAQFDQIKLRKDLTDDWMINYFLSWVFNEMIDMQITLLNKSTMDRAEKIKLFAALKEVSWNYSEDLQDGIEQPQEHYYNQLTEVIKTH